MTVTTTYELETCAGTITITRYNGCLCTIKTETHKGEKREWSFVGRRLSSLSALYWDTLDALCEMHSLDIGDRRTLSERMTLRVQS